MAYCLAILHKHTDNVFDDFRRFPKIIQKFPKARQTIPTTFRRRRYDKNLNSENVCNHGRGWAKKNVGSFQQRTCNNNCTGKFKYDVCTEVIQEFYVLFLFTVDLWFTCFNSHFSGEVILWTLRLLFGSSSSYTGTTGIPAGLQT